MGITFTGKVQALGRLAIPKDLREVLAIEKGDLLEIEIRKITRSAIGHAASFKEKKAK